MLYGHLHIPQRHEAITRVVYEALKSFNVRTLIILIALFVNAQRNTLLSGLHADSEALGVDTTATSRTHVVLIDLRT